jgi:hypothetical protein
MDIAGKMPPVKIEGKALVAALARSRHRRAVQSEIYAATAKPKAIS